MSWLAGSFCRATLYIARPVPSYGFFPSVCNVFVLYRNAHNIYPKLFYNLVHPPFLQTLWQYFDGTLPPNGGVECIAGMKNWFSTSPLSRSVSETIIAIVTPMTLSDLEGLSRIFNDMDRRYRRHYRAKMWAAVRENGDFLQLWFELLGNCCR